MISFRNGKPIVLCDGCFKPLTSREAELRGGGLHSKECAEAARRMQAKRPFVEGPVVP